MKKLISLSFFLLIAWLGLLQNNTSKAAGTGNVNAASTYCFIENPNTFSHNPVNDSAVKVDLIFYNYTYTDSTVVLKWATTAEANSDHFTIEKSLDGITFSAICEIKGGGNSNAVLNYQFSDKNPLSGISYYRLKNTNYDGKNLYAGTIICQFLGKDDYSFNFANPVASDKLDIRVKGESGNIKIDVFNLSGQKVLDQAWYLDANSNLLSIPFVGLQKGFYIIAIITPSGRIYSFPLAKA